MIAIFFSFISENTNLVDTRLKEHDKTHTWTQREDRIKSHHFSKHASLEVCSDTRAHETNNCAIAVVKSNSVTLDVHNRLHIETWTIPIEEFQFSPITRSNSYYSEICLMPTQKYTDEQDNHWHKTKHDIAYVFPITALVPTFPIWKAAYQT